MLNMQSSNLGLASGGAGGDFGKRIKDAGERLTQIGRSRPFVAVVAIAAVVFGLYYFVIAAPLYVADTSFSLRGRDQPSAAGAAAGLLAAVGAPTNSGSDTAEVAEYITSYDMLQKLDKRLHLRELYSRPRADIFHWLPANAHKEEFLRFYKKMVKVDVGRDTNIVKVQVRSFDAASAPAIANAILQEAAVYVDNLSTMVREDSLKTSRRDLDVAEKAVRDSRLAMAAYRANTGLVDPTITAGAESGAIMGLKSQILAAKAELAELRTYSTPNAPMVVQVQARIDAMNRQMNELQSRLATRKSTDTLSQRLYEYEGLRVSNEYAEKQLVAAMGAYDAARAAAGQRDKFLVPVITAHTPDKPTQPNRLLSFVEAMVIAIAAYGIIALVIAGVRDHQGL